MARLESFRPDVSFRRQKEIVWRAVEARMPFFPYDAVQSREGATARLRFEGDASVLDLEPDTLVVLSPRAGGTADRAVVRGGHLDGETRGELWLLTSAALLKLRAREGQAARAKLGLREGSKLAVKLEAGEARIARRESGAGTESSVRVGETVELAAPVAPPDFGVGGEAAAFEPIVAPTVSPQETPRTGKQGVDQRIGRKRLASPTPSVTPSSPEEPAPAELIIDAPRDRFETTQESIIVRGRVTGRGTELHVNGSQATVGENLAFDHEVPLRRGPNRIVLLLVRADGTQSTKTLLVIRRKD